MAEEVPSVPVDQGVVGEVREVVVDRVERQVFEVKEPLPEVETGIRDLQKSLAGEASLG